MSPQSHGVVSLAIFGILILLSALGLMGKISRAEYLSGIFWIIFVDIDHFIFKKGWKYFKDIPDRIFKRGGGGPADEVGHFPSWFHLWPGFILVWLWGFFFFLFIDSSFRFWFPFIFWLIHRTIDRFQKSDGRYPHYSFFYPLIKKLYYRKNGYPVKPPSEFIIDSTILLFVVLVLLGLLILK